MSTAIPNPLNAASLRLKPDFGRPAGVKKLLTRLPVKKPDKNEWIRSHPHPDYRVDVNVILQVEGMNRTYYAVTQEVQEEVADLVVPVTLYTIVTRQNTLLLWPVRLPGIDGKDNDSWASSHDAAERAVSSWIRMEWNGRAYDVFHATGIKSEPIWPEASIDELLQIGFQGKVIDKPDHLLVQKLRGEA